MPLGLGMRVRSLIIGLLGIAKRRITNILDTRIDMIVFESTAIAYSRYDTSQLLHISIIWDVDLSYRFLSAVVHT